MIKKNNKNIGLEYSLDSFARYFENISHKQKTRLKHLCLSTLLFIGLVTCFYVIPKISKISSKTDQLIEIEQQKISEIVALQSEKVTRQSHLRQANEWLASMIPAPSRSAHAAHWSSIAGRYELKLEDIEFVDEEQTLVNGRVIRSDTLLLTMSGNRISFEQLSAEISSKIVALDLKAVPGPQDQLRAEVTIKSVGTL